MIPFRTAAPCPLDGITVLDLSRLVAGNMLSLQLADFGAEVIKVEEPGKDAAAFNASRAVPRRQGSRSNITSPRNVYQTRDGRWIAISGSMQSMAERLYAAVGVPDMTKDPRFATNSARLANNAEAERPIRDFIANRDLAQCLAAFQAAEVTAAPVYEIDQFIADRHVQERPILVDIPDDEMGSVTVHNILPRLSETAGALRRPAPRLGQHTALILARVGVKTAQLAQLRSQGVV